MGFIKNLFTPGKLSKPLNLSVLKTDMHSHLIPGIDDGSDSLETSVELIRGMMELGYQKFITTPHIQGEFFQNTPHVILSGLKKVKRELKKQNIQVEIEAAAEYLIDDQFEAKYKEGELMTFGKKHLLIEFSYFNEHPRLKEFLFDLQIEGYKIILAHPERYSYWFRNFKKYEELKDRGILFQINIISLTGHYSADVKKMAEKFIDEDMVDLAGSDMHNVHYLEALEKSCSEKYLKKLVDSGKLLNSTL
ncbi:MAG: capsular biosynthesis protein [Bacteroidetes bacterium 4572_114]|nr:MAG: capsular biosynthesis protein [Bacteroidetes bacterium 4572_114]